MDLLVEVLDAGLPLPDRARDGDAGIDLFARIDLELSRDTGPTAVPTGIAVAIPEACVGLVCPRSGLAAHQGISVLNAPGIIDQGYRGEVYVVLYAISPETRTVARGDRIAQLLILPSMPVVVRSVPSLPATERGDRGLGSSGA